MERFRRENGEQINKKKQKETEDQSDNKYNIQPDHTLSSDRMHYPYITELQFKE